MAARVMAATACSHWLDRLRVYLQWLLEGSVQILVAAVKVVSIDDVNDKCVVHDAAAMIRIPSSGGSAKRSQVSRCCHSLTHTHTDKFTRLSCCCCCCGTDILDSRDLLTHRGRRLLSPGGRRHHHETRGRDVSPVPTPPPACAPYICSKSKPENVD